MEVNSPRVGDILLGLKPGQLRTRPRLRAASSLVQTALAFFQKKPIRRKGFFRNRFVLCYSNRRIRRLGCICCRMESLIDQTPQFDTCFVWGYKSLGTTALQIRIISKCSTWGQPPFLALSCLHCAQRDEIKSVLPAAECRRDPNLLICWDSFCSGLKL